MAAMDSFYSENQSGFEPRHDSSLFLSRSMRSMARHELNNRSAGCISPATDSDSKLRNPQRRRVPVAVCNPLCFMKVLPLTDLQCRRCRKRKIKCSGDPGDGQGCSNCRSAGNTDCQFLRVSLSPNEAVMQTDSSKGPVREPGYSQPFPLSSSRASDCTTSGWGNVYASHC